MGNSTSSILSPSKPRSSSNFSSIMNFSSLSSSSSVIPAPYPENQEDLLAHSTFNSYYSYNHDKIIKLGYLKNKAVQSYKKQKELAIYQDVLNDALAQFYNECKSIERQYQTAVGENP